MVIKNVKRIAIVFYLLICTFAIAGGEYLQGDSFRLRFVEHTTLTPIVKTEFFLVPRRILLDIGPDYKGGDPNLKFAKPIKSDANGYATLTKKLADELTSNGNIYVDCSPSGYTRFCLRRNNPLAEGIFVNYTITVFDSSNIVAYTINLREDHDNVLLLESNKSSKKPDIENGR